MRRRVSSIAVFGVGEFIAAVTMVDSLGSTVGTAMTVGVVTTVGAAKGSCC